MHEQLWPLYALAGLMGLYTLGSVLRNLYYSWLLLSFIERHHEATELQNVICNITPIETPFMALIKKDSNERT